MLNEGVTPRKPGRKPSSPLRSLGEGRAPPHFCSIPRTHDELWGGMVLPVVTSEMLGYLGVCLHSFRMQFQPNRTNNFKDCIKPRCPFSREGFIKVPGPDGGYMSFVDRPRGRVKVSIPLKSLQFQGYEVIAVWAL
jgi:hypothetical protein